MTVKEYFVLIYENISRYYSLNRNLTVLVLNIWIIMVFIPFIMNCKGSRTTFLTPFMWTILNTLFGPASWICFLTLGCLPIKHIVRPIDTRWNIVLPPLVAGIISRFRIFDESNLWGILMGVIVPAVITIVLVIIEICCPKRNIYFDKSKVGEYEYLIKYKYVHYRKERKKMCQNNEYMISTYDKDEHRFVEKSISLIAQGFIDTCYMIKIVRGRIIKEVLYQKPNREKITILQLDYPIESFLYSYLVGVLVMLWINLPYLLMVVNSINKLLEV